MKKQTVLNIILIILAISLVPIAFYLNPDSEFQGADGQAEEIINKVNPDYVPWISSLWKPPGAETESLLFALQAAIGAAVVAYGLGYFTGTREKKKGDSD
jgi:cobalt/nickel transport protein